MQLRRRPSGHGVGITGPRRSPRLDIPVYLDAGVALSLSASLGKGLVWESSVEKAVAKNTEGSAGIRGGLSLVLPVDAQLGGSRSVAVTESEVRKQTQESIFNAVRHSLEASHLLRRGGDSDDSPDFDTILSLVSEIGELARAVAGVIRRLEDEADASGLVDVVMFESHTAAAPVVAVASLDREYVNTKLLRRLGQGTFGVLGKVVRTPEPGTAFNAFRNSMLGATNQLPVLLTRLSHRLEELPLLLGDAVGVRDEDQSVFLSFVGSASAFTELQPLWLCPSVEIFPVAIYA